jgi:hypothetical protein
VVIPLLKRLHVSFSLVPLLSEYVEHLCFPIDLTKYGSHVYVLVRRGELRASKIMAKRLLNNSKIVSC